MKKSAQFVTLTALVLTLATLFDATAAENPSVSFTVETRADGMTDMVPDVKIVVKTHRAADGTRAQWTDGKGRTTFNFNRSPYPVSLEAAIPGCDADNRTKRTLEEHPDALVSLDVGGVVRTVVRQEQDNNPIPGVVVTLRSSQGTFVAVTKRDGAAVFGCQPKGLKVSVDAALVGYEFHPVLVELETHSTELAIRGRELPSYQVLPAPSAPVAPGGVRTRPESP